MTTDLEKQFFDTFGIKPYIEIGMVDYPTITDRILLELICLFVKEINCVPFYWHTVENLKKDVLEEFILDEACFSKHQVQELFKEER